MCPGLILTTLLTLPAGVGEPVLTGLGRDPARGVLVNCTVGHQPACPPDRARPTVVMVHGANPASRVFHFTIAQALGQSVGQRYGSAINVMGWDWNANTLVGLNRQRNMSHAVEQGCQLAGALLRAGVDPARLHLIGQSSGAIVAAAAARALANSTRRPVGQLTLIDPSRAHHALIFGSLAAGTAACRVENDWVDGPTGFGEPAPWPRVANLKVPLAHPRRWLGYARPLHMDHLNAVRWYIQTATSPAPNIGFGTSVALR